MTAQQTITHYSNAYKFSKDSLFNNVEFLKLWGAQIASQTAMYLLYFILAVEIYNKTESSQAVSYVIVSFGMAALLFGAFAGVFVDYIDKRNVLLMTNVSRFLITLMVLFFVDNYWAAIFIVFLLNSITQFFLPAEASSMPLIVRDKNLLTANSLFTLSLYTSQMFGYILGGLLLEKVGFSASVGFIGGLFLVSAIFILTIKINDVQLENKLKLRVIARKAFSELKDGINYIRDTDAVKVPLTYMTLSMALVAVFFTLLPGYAVEVLGIQAEETSLYLVAPLAVGMILGSLIVGKLKKRFSLERIISIGIISSFIALILIALNKRIPFDKIRYSTTDKIHEYESVQQFDGISAHIPAQINEFLGIDVLLFAMLSMVLLGMSNALVVVVNNTKLQRNTKSGMRGRVYGVMQTLVTVIAIVPVIAGGIIADRIGVNSVFLMIAIAILVLHVVIKVKYRGKS